MPKVLTLRAIKNLNNKALKRGYRYALDSAIYQILDDRHLYPISISLPNDYSEKAHTTADVMVRFVYNEEGHCAWLDMEKNDWDSLPFIGTQGGSNAKH